MRDRREQIHEKMLYAQYLEISHNLFPSYHPNPDPQAEN
jgi:hypothetical protein